MPKVRLGDIGKFARGVSKYRPRNAPELYEGGGFPLVQTGDISKANFKITSHSQEYNERGIQQSKIWPAGTLAITIAANIAETGILDYPMAFPDSVVGFNAYEDKTTNEFVHYLLVNFRKSIQKNTKSSGSIQDNINLEFLNNLKLLVPALSTQKAIVDVLSTLDEKIALNNKINRTLENMVHTIYDYTFAQGEKDEWETVNLINSPVHKVIKTGLVDFDSEKIYYDTKQIDENGVSGQGDLVTNESRVSRANMQPVKHSVWFAKMKNTVKHIVLTNVDDEILNGIFSTGMFGIEVDELAFEYIASFIKFSDFENRKNDLAHGATQQAVNNQDIKQITFKLPDIQTLTKFHSQVAPIFQKIQVNNQESAKLVKLRDFLLPQLMSGRIRLDGIDSGL